MGDDDGNALAELAVMLDSFYVEPDYDEAVVRLKALAVAAPFAIGGVPLWTAEGALDPQWDTVTKPFEFEGEPFKIHILRPVSAVVCGTKQIAFAFVRLSPTEAAKRHLTSLGAQYLRMLLSLELFKLRSELMDLFNFTIYPDNKYFFFPIRDVWGLIPEYDHDLLLPYLSAKMLLGKAPA